MLYALKKQILHLVIFRFTNPSAYDINAVNNITSALTIQRYFAIFVK